MSKPSPALEQVLENNRLWAAGMVARNPDFFQNLAKQQAPQYLWLGCSDSRVPANDLLGLMPGDVFVHRNVANILSHSDLNALSVLQFAIDVLGIKHVIVCGHYGCFGVHAAMTGRRVGLADNWLRHVCDVHQKHDRFLSNEPSTEQRHDRLCELNVIEQVSNVCNTTIIQDAWSRGQSVTVHSLIYGLQDGLLRELGIAADSNAALSEQLQACMTRYANARG